jgi:tetratricopeptide (TPR) repeat protein
VENVVLTDAESRRNIFRESVVANLNYWTTWVQQNQADISVMDREYANIIRALGFALEMGQVAWGKSHRLINNFSPFMERRGHWEIWLEVLKRATETARQLKDTTITISLLMLSVRLLQWQARLSQATRTYRQVIRLARQHDDEFTRARACSNLGFLYAELGYWWRAEILCCHALHIFEQQNSDHGRAHTENHLGVLYTRQKRYNLAQHHLDNACKLWQTMGDNHGLMRGHINLGVLNLTRKQPEATLSHMQKALDLARLVGEETQISLIYLNIGNAYHELGDPVQAEAYARRALTLFKQFSNLLGTAQSLDALGLICLAQNKQAEAMTFFQNSLEIRREIGDKQGETGTQVNILTGYVKTEDWPQAAAQLVVVEQLMSAYNQNPQHPIWREMLADCCQRLEEGLRQASRSSPSGMFDK